MLIRCTMSWNAGVGRWASVACGGAVQAMPSTENADTSASPVPARQPAAAHSTQTISPSTARPGAARPHSNFRVVPAMASVISSSEAVNARGSQTSGRREASAEPTAMSA